ncbi:ATP-dependent DNA helicase RecG [Thiomicrorhabdus sp. zzn3]|uniref:ATP-dependent DNA helicase RecG n=1 Tax=Thiomicrorhabdus sp. zzn3 TaxID=3039775 RepID=UPI00243675B9|nr:ATP-dependent DNA helicase RecG [Thiomicrorhabdus sp. zzn3]MDG6778697.1 ATP-dependent DNA helicase RecG [Thiomicrorhabdus sp. zzn3]
MLSNYPITNLKGVGPKQQEKLHRLGLHTVQDLLFHLPLRYQDKTRLTAIENLFVGQEALVEGEIFSQHLTRGRRNSLLVKIQSPGGGFLTLRFFHFHFRQAQQFVRGKTLRAFGDVRVGPNGLEMVHPLYQFIDINDPPPLERTLTPTYPTTEGFGQASILKLIKQALVLLQQHPLEELLPAGLLKTYQLPDLNHAIRTLHQPQPEDDLAAMKRFTHPAQQRLILEELTSHQVGLQQLRQLEKQRQSPPLPASQMANELIASLPFTLTSAQQRVLQEIQKDLSKEHPMQRLVQGDVGSGKTIVAALAAIQAAEAGFQVAIMAPTEILAEQHRNAFDEWLQPLGIEVAWLSGKMKAAEKRYVLQQIESGIAKVVIGTHALFQEAVNFDQLGLVIIDEQHRFGVHQRLSLQQKGQKIVLEGGDEESVAQLAHSTNEHRKHEDNPVSEGDNWSKIAAAETRLAECTQSVHEQRSTSANKELRQIRPTQVHPHQLIMTATPIPRTLAMTAYGDLDLSVIDELPPGRQTIDTAVISNEKRTEVMSHLAEKCHQGIQAYWVCPLIEESELLHAQAAEVTANQFSERWPELRVGLIHGRLKGEQKTLVMRAFKNHELDLLVATTVIEVGVNVPNASLMIIENAERLGLAQLHQLRGRVGRGSLKSHCVLLYQPPLSETGKARLQIMRETNDGFRIAEEDLKIRGPGEILGTRQTGGLQFRIADLRRDAEWIPAAQQCSAELVTTYPQQVEKLQARWIGDNIEYQHA